MTDTIWATATGERHGKPMVYRYIEKLPPGFDTATRPARIDIVWQYSTDESGMPDASTNEASTLFEDLLEPIEGEVAILALVRTGDGEKEWIYYASDHSSFMERLNELLSDHPRFPIEIDLVEDSEWSLYDSFWNGVSRD